MTIQHEAEVLRKLLNETREQVKMMQHQIDDYQAALEQAESSNVNSITQYQQAIYEMFQAFTRDK